jgi:hypothetical protein
MPELNLDKQFDELDQILANNALMLENTDTEQDPLLRSKKGGLFICQAAFRSGTGFRNETYSDGYSLEYPTEHLEWSISEQNQLNKVGYRRNNNRDDSERMNMFRNNVRHGADSYPNRELAPEDIARNIIEVFKRVAEDSDRAAATPRVDNLWVPMHTARPDLVYVDNQPRIPYS